MRKNVRAAMDALFAGKEYTNASVQTRQLGEVAPMTAHPNLTTSMPTVYSYGHHFPLVMLDGDTAYVNRDQYSRTTSTQQSGVAVYLHYEGFDDTGETVTHRGHTYRVYRKEHAERWPDYSHLPGWNATGTVFERPAHHTTEGK